MPSTGRFRQTITPTTRIISRLGQRIFRKIVEFMTVRNFGFSVWRRYCLGEQKDWWDREAESSEAGGHDGWSRRASAPRIRDTGLSQTDAIAASRPGSGRGAVIFCDRVEAERGGRDVPTVDSLGGDAMR